MNTHHSFSRNALLATLVALAPLAAACGSSGSNADDAATTIPAESTSTSVGETTSTISDTTVADTSTSLAPTTTAKAKPKPGATTTTTPPVTVNIPVVTIQLKPSVTLLTGPPAQTCAQLAGANGKVKIYFDSKLADTVELKTSFAIELAAPGGWVYFTPPTCKSFAVTATAKKGSITGSSKTIVVTFTP